MTNQTTHIIGSRNPRIEVRTSLDGIIMSQAEIEEQDRLARQTNPTAPIVQPVSPAPVQAQSINLGVANINPREYIQVGIEGLGGKPVVISNYELAGSNSKNYEDAHKFVLEKSLYVPTPRIFITHFNNVLEAKKGNKALFYADGSQVPNSEIEEMYNHLTTNHKAVFGSQPGAWTWLNAKFVQGLAVDDLNLETIIGLNTDKTLRAVPTSLEPYLNKNAFINLNFNSQGLASPNSKCGSQVYSQGKNIYFWKPVAGYVAGFDAGSDRAFLYCDRDPTGTYGGLGVFACAEGAGAKK